MAAAAPATAVPQTAADAKDVEAVVATIAKLADGNCATASDVRLVSGAATTRPVRLGLTVKVVWSSTKETRYGSGAVTGSLHCDGFDSVNHNLGKACGAACRDPAVSAGIAERVRKAPAAAYADWKDGHKIADLPNAAHYYDNCGPCSGHGTVDCPMLNCRNGKAPCLHCRQTGVGSCNNCNGSGVTHPYGGQARTCGHCNGSGRWGNCHMCSGSAVVNCTNCGGRGDVRCNSCKGNGSFTYLYRAHLEGKVSRTLAFETGVPEGFRSSCLALPEVSMADGNGVLRRVEATSGPAEATAYLHCEVRHVHASVLVKDVDVTVDAVGPRQAIPLMPAFLDELLDYGGIGHLTIASEKVARSNPAARLAEATRAPATKDILELVGGGSAVDAGAVSRKWKGAISPGLVEKVATRLRRAYAHAGRSSVRRAWIMAAVPIAALMVLANAYHLPLRAFLATWPEQAGYGNPGAIVGFLVAQAAVAVPILAVAWFVAGHRARASLRAGVGSLARARPRQGVWPWAGLVVAVAAGWMATVMRVEAAGAGLPYAPAALPAAGTPHPAPRPVQPPVVAPPIVPVETTFTCPATKDGKRFTRWDVLKLASEPRQGPANTWTWPRDTGTAWGNCYYGPGNGLISFGIASAATQCVSQGNGLTIKCK